MDALKELNEEIRKQNRNTNVEIRKLNSVLPGKCAICEKTVIPKKEYILRLTVNGHQCKGTTICFDCVRWCNSILPN